MKKLLVVLMALAMIVSMLAVFPFAVSADEGETATPVWSGKANIQWYLDAIKADENAETFHLNSAEDLAGLSYLVNAYWSNELKNCYKGLWYDSATGDVLGFSPSGTESGFCYNYEELGFYIPATEEKFNKTNGQYVPEYDEDYENTCDGSVYILGDDFRYKTICLDTDVVINTGNAADWATTAPANVWMPIGGSRSSSATIPAFNGTFMGGGHTISGLYYFSEQKDMFGIGLFGSAAKGTVVDIRDLIVENSYLFGGIAVGALIGRTSNMVTIFNCHVKNCSINAIDNIGSFVGSVHGGSLMMEQCGAMDISIEGQKVVGGLIGSVNYQGYIATDCIVAGTVRAFTVAVSEETTTGGWDAGVLIGRVGQGSTTIIHVVSDVTLIQESDQDSSKSYSPAAGAIYGAVAKTLSAPVLSVEGYYYVNKIQAAGTITQFPLATVVQEKQLLGKAPKATLLDFDFDTIWDCGATGELPVLRNAGKSTYEGEKPDDPTPVVTDEHMFTPDTWVKEKKATCVAEGVKGHYECPHCGKNFAADKETELSAEDLKEAKTEHTYGELIAEVAATTEAAGTVEHYHCETCGKNFDKDHKEIADITIAKLEKSGCGGVIVGAPFVAVVVLGAAVLLRKKENESK